MTYTRIRMGVPRVLRKQNMMNKGWNYVSGNDRRR